MYSLLKSFDTIRAPSENKKRYVRTYLEWFKTIFKSKTIEEKRMSYLRRRVRWIS